MPALYAVDDVAHSVFDALRAHSRELRTGGENRGSRWILPLGSHALSLESDPARLSSAARWLHFRARKRSFRGTKLPALFIQRFAKALQQADARLQATGSPDLDSRIAKYKRLLSLENKWLALQRKKREGLELGAMRAQVIDAWLCHLLDMAAANLRAQGRKPPAIAMVAVGGYGRSEMNPLSDIDFTILHRGGARLPDGLEEMVKELLHLIAACGFKSGDSTRNLAETIAEANSEMQSKTAMLDARFLWGDESLFAQFKSRFERACVRPYVQEYLEERVKDQARRHAKDGHVVYMQEPNIKDGCGGLRDYQNLLWMARFKYGVDTIRSTEDLVERKYLNESERRELDRAYEFIFRLRTELHYLTDRPTDVIFVSQQRSLADRLDYAEDHPDVLRRVEAFMRDYYMHARAIFEVAQLVCERLALPVAQTPDRKGIFRVVSLIAPPRRRKREEFDGFFALDGRIEHVSRQIFKEDRGRMMRLFQHVQQRNLAISPELRQLVRRRLKYVDNTFRYAKAHREVFAALLRQKGQVGPILRAMHRVDFLGKWLPEFGQLTALVQHEYFHRYTVDEHTLVTIEKLDSLLDTDDERFQLHRDIFRKLEDPYVLYLALILHDTGKAANAKQHAVASTMNADKVARRLQLNRDQRTLLISLVDNHDLLSKTARHRDIYDPETVEWVAGIVQSQETLDALMLITAADGLGVGDDKLWNDWAQSLVRELYLRVSQYFDDSTGFRARQRVARDEMLGAVMEKLPAEYELEIRAHFRGMPERYFQLPYERDAVASIVSHIKMVREFLETRWNSDAQPLAPVLRWTPQPHAGHSELWVCTWDRAELLARIAGALSATELNILSADIFTRSDGIVLDKFRVSTPRYEAVDHPVDLRKVERLLNAALAVEHYDFQAELAKVRNRLWGKVEGLPFPPRVWFDNSPPKHTVMEVLAPDRLGLLYELLGQISDDGFEIAAARITTEKGAAMDTFHLTGREGKKITDVNRLIALKYELAEIAGRSP
jgi:[protein-PII] uridylyltransferase